MVRASLVWKWHSGLTGEFWYTLVNTGCYLLDNTPMGKTPGEARRNLAALNGRRKRLGLPLIVVN